MADDIADDSPLDNITAAQRLVRELSDGMEKLLERIGKLESPHPTTTGPARGGRTVPPTFIRSMIRAVEDLPEVRDLGTFDPDEALAMLQFNDAFHVFATHMAILLTRVRFTMESRKADIAAKALSTFAVMKGLARDPRNSRLGPRVDILAKELGRKGRPKKPRE